MSFQQCKIETVATTPLDGGFVAFTAMKLY
jgi:hypothetical protein